MIGGVFACGGFVRPGRGRGVRTENRSERAVFETEGDGQGVLYLQLTSGRTGVGENLTDVTAPVTQAVQVMDQVNESGAPSRWNASPGLLVVVVRFTEGPQDRDAD